MSLCVVCGVFVALGLLGLVIALSITYSNYGDDILYTDMPSDMRLLKLPFFYLFCEYQSVESSIPGSPHVRRSNSELWFDIYMLEWDPTHHISPNRIATSMTGTSLIRPHRYESFRFHLIQNSTLDMKLDVTNCSGCASSFAVYIIKSY